MARMHRGLLAALIAALIAAGPGRSVPRTGPAASREAAQPAARARGGTLPDTVLARIGAGREVSHSRFLAAWKQLGPSQRPDSLTPETAREFLQLLIGKEALGLRERWVWAAGAGGSIDRGHHSDRGDRRAGDRLAHYLRPTRPTTDTAS